MNKEWTTKKLVDVATLQRGFDLPRRHRIGGEIPLVSSSGIIDTHNISAVRGPGVVTGRSGSVGNVFYIEGAFWPLNTVLYVKDFHGNDPRFIFHLLNKFDLKRFSSGAGVPTLNRNFVHDELVSIPPLREQRRIVGILDKAFDGIATAKANAEKNLQNARALFESHLQAVFTHGGEGSLGSNREDEVLSGLKRGIVSDPSPRPTPINNDSRGITRTGGRQATLRHIPGRFSLAVGMPKTPCRKGWRWTPLARLARLESGHTPSRKHQEYWGGVIPWIGIQDARDHHGHRIYDTSQHTNELGIANSSARVLPENTVCLSRTASVGYVVITGKPMATSQDFVNWVCSDMLDPDFLKYIFLAEGKELLRFSNGAVHQTIYFPEAKAFHICHPTFAEQVRIAMHLDAVREEARRLKSVYQRQITFLDELKQSLLHQAFIGAL